ncbi:related to ECM32-DNA dependent ATPase/DNA helicase B [Serendipita indica DSM 11827]|uniref:Related to ECM32-DNA dependent ATPase/DNA helicase B n=1 Tax=Serendipita indica (strain DSM 11827) TaxID=1109443 RepID=G4TNW7_SERID|nr:related to ECM32-DNA dependent ATPase/DNA helicase B [Serendipita indica DSM 11827]
MSKPCSFYNTPRGCRNGDSCRFLHQQSTQSSANKPPISPTSPSGSAPKAPYQPRVQLTSPLGICRYYWNYGSCRNTVCSFKHVEAGNMTPDTDRFTTGFGPVLAAAARQSAPQPTISTNVTASEALQHLSVFCSPTFTFSKPFQIVSFVNLLVNAASKHRSWDNSDSRQFLETLTQSHGLARIEAILTFDNVVTVLNNPRDAIAFSSTYINCLSYFVSEAVLHSTLKQRVNSLYGLIHNNFDRIHVIINECMDDIVSRKSFETRPGLSSGFTVFSTLVEILIQYVIRYQNALRDHPVLYSFCHTLFSWHTMWSEGGYIDGWVVEGEQQKQIALSNLGKSIERLANIIERENSAIRRKTTPSSSGGDSGRKQKNQDDTLRRVLDMYYDPPGQLRGVRRHDNDLENIRDISIPPTEQEMLCRIAPFLPANIPSGPHYLDDNSMERLLDIQFRLLREELLAALRVVLQSITHNIHNPAPNNALETLLASEGGKYIAHSGGNDSVMVNLYTSVDPIKVVCDKRGISVAMSVATPPGPARATSIERRAEYWRYACRKRLMPGGLVALIWQTGQSVKIYFGLLSSTPDEIQTNARASSESLVIRVRFFDPIVNLKVMDWIQTSSRDRLQTRIFLVESPVMYESIRPFLEGLKREPTSVPFAQILVHGGHPRVAGLPRYIEADPQFSWDLKSLVRLEHPDRPALRLNPRDPGSTENARQILCSHSRLDRSQVDAMVDCLTKSFVLIQGPPGTGKSFTGVELMRVLLANHRGPILLIAFTNHALDHLLLSVLKANITSKIVRLGSRSSDEEVGEYALENLEKMDPASDSDNRSLYRAYGEMRSVESELKEHLEQLHADEASEEDLIEYLELFYPEHVDEIRHPSQFIRLIRPHEEGWTEVTRARGTQDTLYQYWAHSKDLQWISNCQEIQRKQVPVAANRFALLKPERDGSEDESDQSKDDDDLIFETEEQYNLRVLLENAGLRSLPPLPTSNRPLDQLIQEPKVWQMSISERSRISRFWKTEAKKHFIQRHRDIFSHCKDQFESAKQRYDEVRDQMRSRLLRKADIVGCTTTGAAKLASLLFSFKPRILLVEEAGQVLEAHILGALVESIEHVIEIGDPLQLRPTITNYALSCDHPLGGKIYKLDQSTMERLSESGMTMSKLHVQRRMRGQIATLARLIQQRTTLYPQLIDDESVSRYPNVKGMAKNIFFLHHTNAEGGGTNDESTSKFNQYEAAMTKALVQHLLRQGLYTRSGSIVILCMYLGQLVKVRDELRNSRINVVFDERDLDALRDNGIDVDSDATDHGVELQEVRITDQVLIRTVDNFQGQEPAAFYVHTDADQSPNRANVALTRARHGFAMPTILSIVSSNVMNDVVRYAPKDILVVAHAGNLVDNAYSPSGRLRLIAVISCEMPHETVEKLLPQCGHFASIECHLDPLRHSCQDVCGTLMACCQKSCQGRCGACKQPSVIDDGASAHFKHRCGRTLHCQHQCASLCTEEHRAICGSEDCQQPCRQSCDHHECKEGCSVPCTPCMMACNWTCEHSKCDVPCGSPCVRLPCDLRCPLKLRCGHSCPSLCGEPCDRQMCHLCATQDQSQVVVDLILGLTIADLDPTSQELDNVTITLRCGHTFTVETLDGVCELGQYYRKHEVTGRWLSPIQRLEAFVKTPCCPTCRRPIEAQRYGRALKRGNLDILERNVATTMARELQSMQQELSTISTAGTDIDVLLPFNVLEERFLSQKDYRTKILTPGRALPIVNERLLGLQMRKRASDILAGRAAHMVAYEASYSMLYEHELARVQKGPFAPKYPERVALQSAKTKIGMPPPRADTRFKVEAIWMTIDIRHVLGSLAEKIHSRLSSQASHSQQQLEALQQFIIFIYHSCQLDSNAAIKIAQSSDAYRQELLSSMRQIKTTWRLVRVEKALFLVKRQMRGRLEEARLAARTVRNACSTKSGANFAMISQEFDAPMEKVFKQWQELGDHLSRPSVFYQPVSDDELYAVIGSFTEYRHRGHWYTCPNGHIFTIADCGGATMTSQCHECGAVIGGTGHATVQGVQQAVNLERIAESQGAVQSPWGWNRNV